MKTINEAIICAGFGGQGIMVLGKMLANAGISQGLNVTWLPSYGAEVRGGTAHTMVRISTEPIMSPVVSMAESAIIMNGPSLDKFEDRVAPGGLLILNTSLAREKVKRKDIEVIEALLTDEAIKLGNARVANVIAAGIFAAKKGLFDKALLFDIIGQMAGDRKEIIPVNRKAIERGMEIASICKS